MLNKLSLKSDLVIFWFYKMWAIRAVENKSSVPVELRDDLADGLGSTSGGWDDVLGSTTTTAPILQEKQHNETRI
jgi:hypothetical protein